MPMVKVANPAKRKSNPASSLLVINPKGTTMRKRKTTRRKKANPASAAKRRVSIKVNPKRRTSRRRNPSSLAGLGIVKDGFFAAGGGVLTSWVRSMVPISFGGQIGDAAITAGVAIGLGELVARFLNREAGKMVTLGGVTVAATQLLNTYGLTPQQLFAPKTVKVVPTGTGDFVALKNTAYDPYYGRTLAGVPSGMRDFVSVAPQPRY